MPCALVLLRKASNNINSSHCFGSRFWGPPVLVGACNLSKMRDTLGFAIAATVNAGGGGVLG
jgi:hypothetical protein